MSNPYYPGLAPGNWDPNAARDQERAQQENDLFNQHVRELMQNVLHATGQLPEHMSPPPGVSIGPAMLEGASAAPQQVQTPEHYQRLLDAARFWGIDGADQMDPQRLQQEIEARRSGIDRPETLDWGTALAASLAFPLAGAEGFARTSDNLVGFVEQVPFAGEALKQIGLTGLLHDGLQRIQSRTAESFEQLAAMLPQANLQDLASLRGTGHFAGSSLPAILTWEAAGALGNVPGIGAVGRYLSPWQRLALRGMVSADMMVQADPSLTDEQKGEQVAIGGAIGAGTGLVGWALGRVGPWLQRRLAQSFPIPGDEGYQPPPPGEEWAQIIPETPDLPRGPGGAARLSPGAASVQDIAQDPFFSQGLKQDFVSQYIGPERQLPARGGTTVNTVPFEPPSIQTVEGKLRSGLPLTGVEEELVNFTPSLQNLRNMLNLVPREALTPTQNVEALIKNGLPLEPEHEALVQQHRSLQNLQYMKGLQDAQTTAANITKQTQVLESPAMTDIVAKPELRNEDVAVAAVAANPGGVSVVRNIGDAADLSVSLTNLGVPHRLVDGPYGSDVLVGPIEDAQVAQYQQHGLFDGMDVTTSNGVVGRVSRILDNGKVVVRKEGGGPPLTLRRENVQPGTSSRPTMELPELYDGFRQSVLDYANGEVAKAGQPPVADMTDPRVGSILAGQADEFFNQLGVPKEIRPALLEDFQQRWVGEFRGKADEIAKEEALLYHYGTYVGGPSDPSRSITESAGNFGSGLYFASDPKYLPDIVPGLLYGRAEEGAATRAFRLKSDVRLFDMEAPPKAEEVLAIARMIDPEMGRALVKEYRQGKIETNRDLLTFNPAGNGDWFDHLPGEADSFNRLLMDLGYHGLKTSAETNLFHPEAGNYVEYVRDLSPLGSDAHAAQIEQEATDLANARENQQPVVFGPINTVSTLDVETELVQLKQQRTQLLQQVEQEPRPYGRLSTTEQELSRVGSRISKLEQEVRIAKFGMSPEELSRYQKLSDDELLQEIVKRNTRPATDYAFEDEVGPQKNRAEAEQLMHLREDRRQARPQTATAEAMYEQADRLGAQAQQIRESADSGEVEPIVGETYSTLLEHGSWLTEMGMAIEAGYVPTEQEQNLIDRLMAVRFDEQSPSLPISEPVASPDAAGYAPRPAPAVEELAESKGYRWIPDAGDGGSLHDVTSAGAPLQFGSDDAARTFLQNVDRGGGPDLTPDGPVPFEVARIPANSDIGKSGSDLEPKYEHDDFMRAGEFQADDMGREADEMEDDIISYQNRNTLPGMGFGPPRQPPQPPMPPGGGFAPPPGGPFEGGPWYVGGQLRPPTLAEQFEEAGTSAVMRVIRKMQSSRTRYLRFMRYAMLDLTDALNRIGVNAQSAWADFDALDVSITKMENAMAPWLERANKEFITLYPREALPELVARIHEIPDAQTRVNRWAQEAQKRGWDEQTLQNIYRAEDAMSRWWHEIFMNEAVNDPAIALTAEREIFQYIPHVRAAQDAGVRNPFQRGLTKNVEFFAEHAREGNLQMRQLDIRDLVHYYTKAMMWKKHVADAWQNYSQHWDVQGIPDGIRSFMTDWARVARFGVDAEQSAAIRGIQSIFRSVLRIPITGNEAAQILGTPFRWAYTGFTGGRLAPMFRDAIQPLLTMAKAPGPVLAGVYRDLATQSQSMWQNGLRGGWVEKAFPDFEMASLFERSSGSSRELLAATPEQLAHRQAASELLGRLRDLFPRKFSLQWLLDAPIKPYMKQQMIHRMIAGEVGHRTATAAIGAYRQWEAAVRTGTEEFSPMGWNQLLDRSMASSFEEPIQRLFEQHVRFGQDAEAADLMARQLADWSQFRGGSRATAPGLRSPGGKLGTFLGSYPIQMLSAIQSMVGNSVGRIPSIVKEVGPQEAFAAGGPGWRAVRWGVKGLTVFGLLHAALAKAKEETGWSFDRWSWVNSMLYTGSPALEGFANAYLAASGSATATQGYRPGSTEQEAMRQFDPVGMLGGFVGAMNPYAGTVKSLNEYFAASQSADSIEQYLRFSITGDRGSRISMQRGLEQDWVREQPMDPRYQYMGRPEGTTSPNGGTNVQNHPSQPLPGPRNAYPPGAGAF